MKRHIYAAIAALMLLAGCDYHPYYDGQVMRVYQSKYGLIEEDGVHLNVPITDRQPYTLEIYGGKGEAYKVTVSDPDILDYTYTEPSVKSFLGQEIVPATVTLDPHRLGDTSIEIMDVDTGESIRIELHVVNVFYMIQVYDTRNSLDAGVVIAFEYPDASDDVKMCRRDHEGELEYLFDAKCRFYDCDTTLIMELDYLADQFGQPEIDGDEITRRYVVEFADGYSYGGPSYLMSVLNLGYITPLTKMVKDDFYEHEYDTDFRFVDVTDDEMPDLESPDTKMFYARSARLEPWLF